MVDGAIQFHGRVIGDILFERVDETVVEETGMDEIYDVIIIGAGPAGLTAGLYARRAKLRTLIVEKGTLGGELMNRDLIENWPGYPDGILGPELASNMIGHVMSHGAEMKLAEAKSLRNEKNHKVVETSEGDNYLGNAIIIAGGAYPKKLGVAGEEEFADRGVFYCATCDGPGFADKVVAVVGGGDSGITEGLFLARFASKVIIIELSPHLTASKILQERAVSDSKIEIKCGTKVEAIIGDEHVNSVNLIELQTGKRRSLQVDGVLVHVGVEPNTAHFGSYVPVDSRSQILVNEERETRVPGVFAAGDIREKSPMQITTAVGDGATAALSAVKFISLRGG